MCENKKEQTSSKSSNFNLNLNVNQNEIKFSQSQVHKSAPLSPRDEMQLILQSQPPQNPNINFHKKTNDH